MTEVGFGLNDDDRCLTAQTLDPRPFLQPTITGVVVAPGTSQTFTFPGSPAITVDNTTTGASIFVTLRHPLPVQATLYLQPGATPGSCAMGTGPVAVAVANNCAADAFISLSEETLSGNLISFIQLAVPVGQTGTFLVQSSSAVFIQEYAPAFLPRAGPFFPEANPADRFFTLTPVDGVCTLVRTPGTATLTVRNTCSRPVGVTFSDVADGLIGFQISTTILELGASFTYTFSSAATTLVQVCWRPPRDGRPGASDHNNRQYGLLRPDIGSGVPCCALRLRRSLSRFYKG